MPIESQQAETASENTASEIICDANIEWPLGARNPFCRPISSAWRLAKVMSDPPTVLSKHFKGIDVDEFLFLGNTMDRNSPLGDVARFFRRGPENDQRARYFA